MRGTRTTDGMSVSQGLTMQYRKKQMNLKLREVSERRQVGDTESMFNEGTSTSTKTGFFGKHGQL